jgi:hypothetical protein
MAPVKQIVIVVISLCLFLAGAHRVAATLGVGVGTGKIVVDETLRPGQRYELPPLTVINTGDETAEYSVGIAYHQDQSELPPEVEWFEFSPKEFKLEPKGAQEIKITLDLPIKMTPGDYFAYLEGFPIMTETSGESSVNIAAAAKLYFKVEPANVFVGLYYKINGLWNATKPWSNIGIGLLLVGLAIKLFKKHFNFAIKLDKKSNNEDES